ncbi:MAG TPA: biopolymer transporter ExbD [Longimicrobiales bacterium]
MEHDVKDTNVMAEINVTPMVDVMLVLLIIFMVVTPTLMAGFQAELPKGLNLIEKPDDEERTTLGIDAQGAYYINKVGVPGCGPRAAEVAPAPACESEMRRILTSEFERHPEDRVLFVKADASLQYGELLRAMDYGRDAGAVVLAAVTETVPGAEEEE